MFKIHVYPRNSTCEQFCDVKCSEMNKNICVCKCVCVCEFSFLYYRSYNLLFTCHAC